VAVDLFTLERKDYIIMVDDYSNYFEFNVLNETTAAAIITSLKSQFARHGIPEEVKSDNGPQFASTSFENFAREWEFKHITSSPYYAQSNGKVENSVKTAKKILKKAQPDKRDPYLALLAWRNTPTEGLNSSPVQRLMGRRTRTPLPTSKEQVTNKRRKQAQYYNWGSKPLPELKPGDVVRISRSKLFLQDVEKLSLQRESRSSII
jgi:transposase InsO family protein